MGTLQRSIALTKASWAVLRQDKELAVLPILSFAAWLVIAATFVLPIVADRTSGTDPGDSWTSKPLVTGSSRSPATSRSTYVMIFFNAAIVCGADERLQRR